MASIQKGMIQMASITFATRAVIRLYTQTVFLHTSREARMA